MFAPDFRSTEPFDILSSATNFIALNYGKFIYNYNLSQMKVLK